MSLYSGALITGERIKRTLKGGGVRTTTTAARTTVPTRVTPSFAGAVMTLEVAFGADLGTIHIPDGELAVWINRALQAAFSNTSEV